MNCEEYKEGIAADPSFEDGASHAAQCASCRTYRDEILALNQKIGQALMLPVPELRMPLRMPELEDIEAGKVVALTARRRFGAPTWLAVAATVMVAAFLGFRMYSSTVTYPSLADEIIAHLDHEPYALRITDKPVTDRRLARVVPANIANMDHDAGLITYAQSCVINGRTVPHLVIQGENGPITILLMPDEMLHEAVELHGESINGVILPVGDGSIAIIGEGSEDLKHIEEEVVNSVMWST